MTAVRDNFQRGVDLLMPYIHVEGQQQPVPPDERMRQAMALLESAARADVCEANWFLGKGFESLGEFERSAERFYAAYLVQSEVPAVCHELILALLRIKRIPEATQVAEGFQGDDPLILFDHALCLFSTGKYSEALRILTETKWPESRLDSVQELARRIKDRVIV